jgi:hypothetical protein
MTSRKREYDGTGSPSFTASRNFAVRPYCREFHDGFKRASITICSADDRGRNGEDDTRGSRSRGRGVGETGQHRQGTRHRDGETKRFKTPAHNIVPTPNLQLTSPLLSSSPCPPRSSSRRLQLARRPFLSDTASSRELEDGVGTLTAWNWK